ncbi:NAD(P)-dependent glyceraldehyde 3-phosphate dehydrogenase archaeal [Halarchaeum acidiphilum MH1-52-1]|uniref:Glyceraldehyde-3-phosphate dehydrogenase n=1 Tax=Halarchaeum acidiphilum MH1-52-1 TaxID=1261545 RepID=U2YH14_9EURY|nr:type II glyceraldehyde-3-phosphate dehydrogenase [Halarchaeum acidiphilum]GAD53701.1 NAD(P)-dependent glyceraldehyde 3-phosphate dehydrogenase archaeal [Halarchaeum acidiphilum MH1-52-1]
MLRVGVNGYGTIGKRVADALAAQPDMEVAGVAKTTPNFEAAAAHRRGYAVHAALDERRPAFDEAGIPVAGDLDDLVRASDVVVDCTPAGVGAQNRERYETHDTPALYQGGEDADAVDASFNARANYDEIAASDAEHVRVVSCNTTGLSRVLAPLEEAYGVEKTRATLVRRGGDPGQSDRGPINDILPDPVTVPSHHGPDVNTVLPDLAVDTMGVTVPATLMHLHAVNVTLETEADADAVSETLASESRVFVVPERARVAGPAHLKEYAKDAGRPRGDLWENCVWGASIAVEGRDLYFFQAIHQESDVVPENVDAIRALAGDADAAESVVKTNRALGVGSFETTRSETVTTDGRGAAASADD